MEAIADTGRFASVGLDCTTNVYKQAVFKAEVLQPNASPQQFMQCVKLCRFLLKSARIFRTHTRFSCVMQQNVFLKSAPGIEPSQVFQLP